MALTSKAWRVNNPSNHSWDEVTLQEQPVPEPLDDFAVLVHWHYACLNYRDLIIPLGKYPLPVEPNVVLGSDAAGEVVRIGSKVTLFRSGDRVLPLPAQDYQTAPFKLSMVPSILGSSTDGVFQEYSVYNERGLVSMPATLDFKQGSTLPTATLTAWNALFGLEGKKLKAGQWVLCQGTGGTSVAAVQLAKAVGARVIATSSSAAKCERLRQLGADHVINYKETRNWGEEAKRLTGGEGVAHVIEIGGADTQRQSLEAVETEGVVNVIGFISATTSNAAAPTLMEALVKCCIVRGLINGSREQFVEMNAFIDKHRIQPVVDKKEFAFEEMKEAFQYTLDGRHVGKVAVKI